MSDLFPSETKYVMTFVVLFWIAFFFGMGFLAAKFFW